MKNGLDSLDAQSRATMERALADFPERDRQMLHEIFFEERSHDEVCQKFQVEDGYLRMLVHRAQLRQRVAFAKRQVA